MEEELIEWCIWDWAKETDFIFDEAELGNLPTLFEKDDIIFEYNQWSSVDCTIYWAVWAVSDLTNYEYTKEHIANLVETSFEPKRWRIRWNGWFVENACHLIKDDWNNNPELVAKYGKIAYYRVKKVNDEIIQWILDKKYTLVGNRSTASEFTSDYRTDWVLDGKDFWTKTNWHCIDIISYKWVRSEKNSYKGRKTYDGKKDCNIFELKHKLAEITNYWPNFYLFTLVKEDNYEELKRLEEFKTKLNITIENNSAMWHITNDKAFQDKLHEMNEYLRKKVSDCDEQIRLHS